MSGLVTLGSRELGKRCYHAVVVRVLSRDPIHTEELFRCAHHHRRDQYARLCRDAAAFREAHA